MIAGEIVTEELYMRRCEGDKDWPFWDRCAICPYCREIRVQISKLAVFRQNLYLEKNRHKVIFDLEEGIEFPIDGKPPIVNRRVTRELVCVAGRPVNQFATYLDAFRPIPTGRCWQQRVFEDVKTLCNHCASDISNEDAVDIPNSQQESCLGRVDQAGKGGLRAIGNKGTYHRLTKGRDTRLVVCATMGCGTILFTQEGLDLEGGD